MKILGIGNAIVDVICKVEEDFIQKIDSFSNKIWYKRFVDLL